MMQYKEGDRVHLVNIAYAYGEYCPSAANTVGNTGTVANIDFGGFIFVVWDDDMGQNSYSKSNLEPLISEKTTVNTQDE